MATEDQLKALVDVLERIDAKLSGGAAQMPLSLENAQATTETAATPPAASATGRRPRGRPAGASPEATAAAATPAITYEDLRSNVLGFAKSHGMDKAVEILASFGGAKTAKEVPPEQWPALNAKINAAKSAGAALA